MRAFRFLNLAILSTLVASSAVLYAQDEKPQEEKPPRQEEPKGREAGKPAPKQDEMKPPRQEEPKGQEAGKPASRQDEMKPPRQEEAKPEKQEQKRDEKQSREQMNNARQEPAQQQQGYGRQEPNQQQEGHARSAGKGGHIPDDRFHAQFGREHRFKVQRPVEVEGGQGFVYGGYSFVLVDAWPPDWAYTDDCYVDYIDGEYFLIDLFHPDMRLALMVVM